MNKLKELNGQEIWTNSEFFGERVCVLVKYPYIVVNGSKFKPNKKEVSNMWNDYMEQEIGTKEQMWKDLDKEFGKR